MLLFKEPHRRMILHRTKTETRRPTWKPNSPRSKTITRKIAARPAKPGSTHLFYTRPPFAKPSGEPFCSARILTVEREQLSAVTGVGAIAEGYATRDEYCEVWNEIWGRDAWKRDCMREVYVIRFEVDEQFVCAQCWKQWPSTLGLPWQHSPELYCIECHRARLQYS